MPHQLERLEDEGWQALSAGATAATSFYERVLDDGVVMLLPGGLVVTGRTDALASMTGQPWSTYELSDVSVLEPTADVGIVTYAVIARRESQPPYSALVSSIYVRRGSDWRLILHQQTPR